MEIPQENTEMPKKAPEKCPHSYWVFDYDYTKKVWCKKCMDCGSIIG